MLSNKALLVHQSALFCICHELMQSIEGFHGFVEITTECPFLSAIWVPLVQPKSDVIALCPLKIVDQGPVEHAPHIDAVLDCSCNLHKTMIQIKAEHKQGDDGWSLQNKDCIGLLNVWVLSEDSFWQPT